MATHQHKTQNKDAS